jgi:hypothetical protein
MTKMKRQQPTMHLRLKPTNQYFSELILMAILK